MLRASLVIASLLLPATASASGNYLGFGTANLMNHKIERQLERKAPSWNYTRQSCQRLRINKINCGIVARKYDEYGIREVIFYTVHVTKYRDRSIWARTTDTGPMEE